MTHEKLRELTVFQHWLGTNYNDLPTDSGTMTDRARKYLADTKPVVKNDRCSKGVTWVDCTEPVDQCCICENFKP